MRAFGSENAMTKCLALQRLPFHFVSVAGLRSAQPDLSAHPLTSPDRTDLVSLESFLLACLRFFLELEHCWWLCCCLLLALYTTNRL